MESVVRYLAPPSPCGYLPDRSWRLEYEHFLALSPAEYMDRMLKGWRRFGRMLFRPACRHCQECRSLRVLVDEFRPNRSQKRTQAANEADIRLEISIPRLSEAKLALYDKYHHFQAYNKGWPLHPAKDPEDYTQTFIDNPFPTEEWCYFLGEDLVGVGYVDALPKGLSAIYFFYDPELRRRSLGTWNVLRIIGEAAKRGLPHVYLGYYVAGCPSMTYKSRFVPNQTLGTDGQWQDFQR